MEPLEVKESLDGVEWEVNSFTLTNCSAIYILEEMRQSLLHLYIPNPIYSLNHDGDWCTSPTMFLVLISCPQPELLSSLNYSSFFPVQTPSPLSSGSSEPTNAFFPPPQSLTLTNENLAFMIVIIPIILKQWFLTLAALCRDLKSFHSGNFWFNWSGA